MTEKLIEAGWDQVRQSAIGKHAPQDQIDDTRLVYFAGALHMFTVLDTVLDAGEEMTEADTLKVQAIAAELSNFQEQLMARAQKS